MRVKGLASPLTIPASGSLHAALRAVPSLLTSAARTARIRHPVSCRALADVLSARPGRRARLSVSDASDCPACEFPCFLLTTASSECMSHAFSDEVAPSGIGTYSGVLGAIAAAERRKDFRMRRQDVAESAGQARTACPARSVRNPERAKGPAQRAGELARGAGAGPAPTGPARSPAAGEMKLPRCQANETCAKARLRSRSTF